MKFCIGLFTFLFSLFMLFFLIGDERMPNMKDAVILADNLREHVRNIHFDRNPRTRYQELEQAAQYIEREFLRLGLEVEEDSFQWEGRLYRNVVAVKRGGNSPNQVFILGAHYDTVSGSPGADDNASAIAVLLELARMLQPLPLNPTVKMIAFTLEEYDFVGSTHYAEEAKRRGEQIVGMISLEMIGYTGPRQDYPAYLNPKYYPNVGDFIGIIGNEGSKGLLEGLRRSFITHIPELPSEFILIPGNGEVMEEVRLSDHSPFWDRGFPALMVTDTAFLRNPNYHLSTDTIETLNFEFMRKVALGLFYSVMELAK
jgi:aminopeptidase YwaD